MRPSPSPDGLPAPATRRAAGPAEAAARAAAWLAGQARQGFPECVHRMKFPDPSAPPWADGLPQASGGFARSVLAGVLLDLHAAGDRQAPWQTIAAAEAEALAQARLGHLAGGWSYFPDLPTLPPDIDSLGAALALLARIAPQRLELCAPAVALALDGQQADGRIPTWLIGDADPPLLRAQMQQAVQTQWGDLDDLDAQARLLGGLVLAGADALGLAPGRLQQAVEAGLAHLLAAAEPQPGGADWPTSWYAQREELTLIALPLLRTTAAGRDALRAAIGAAAARRWRWPQETAQSLWLQLQPEAPALDAAACAAAAELLVDHQALDGSWDWSDWIRMDAGRAQGDYVVRMHWGCRTLATAFALRALVGAQAGALSAAAAPGP